MKRLLAFVFCLFPAFMAENLQTKSASSSFSGLRQRVLLNIKMQSSQSNHNATNSSLVLQNEEFEPEITHPHSTTYAIPSK